MEFSERIGYGGRVKNAIAGVFIGLLMFFGSFGLHGWNERNAVRETKAINELEKVAIADVPNNEVDEAKEGQLVHMNGTAETTDIVKNRLFGIEETGIRLTWNSSIYQMKETRKKKDDKVTYSYRKGWHDNVIDSSSFKRNRGVNDGSRKTLPNDGRDQASNVAFGRFKLNGNLIAKIKGAEDYPLLEVPPSFEDRGTVSEGVYFTGSPGAPEIGDEKISFKIVRSPKDVTVMAQQAGNSFTAYQTKVGKTKELLYNGLLSKADVILKQRNAAALLRWGLRGLGFILMWFGLSLIAKPISAVLSFIPFMGRVADTVTSFVTFFIAACLSLVAIAAFWLAFRPLLSAALLVGAAACVYSAMKFRRSRTEPGSLEEAVPASGPRPPPPPVRD